MKARLIVFPIKGRNWCFSRSIDHSILDSHSSQTPSTLKDLWKKISSSASNEKPARQNAELFIDFIANKMNKAWMTLEKAPAGSFKNKIHGLGLQLLATTVKPSEIFFKSISNEVRMVEVTYPSSLKAQMVRRRLRHIAFRGCVMHKKLFYGSASLLPLTSAFSVLPLPNVFFFWVLFRTYSHWRALKGSEKLLQLVSNNGSHSAAENSEKESHNSLGALVVFQPSEELEKLLGCGDGEDGPTQCAISEICKMFHLNTIDVLRYRDSM